ncbi:MAG: hypothetical protein M1813_007680 [Trichoglossum hirsutum]|nr:MAG: hypothetical protein M1813_007680 [Trichoglossum hirsutum]
MSSSSSLTANHTPTRVPHTPPNSAAAQSALRSEINRALLHDGYVEKIQQRLLTLLQASGWSDAVHELCVETMRSNGDGEGKERRATSYGELMERVREKAKAKIDENTRREGVDFIKGILREVCEVTM